MSQDRDLDTTVTVTRGDVTVEKSFEPDEFPVPAVTFDISSSSDEAIDVRLVDQIPEEFPMSAIGFHPEFESDNWSAYKDHRVVFERVLEPDEQLTTVYGVRLDREEDAVAFLTEPTLEGIDDNDESVDDLLGEDRNQAIRDVLAGERESLVDERASERESLVDEQAGGSEQHATSGESTASSDAVAQGEGAGSQDDVPELDLEDPTDDTGATTADPRTVQDDADAAIVDASSVERADAESDAASTDDDTGEDEAVPAGAESVAAALAAEIRDGRVDDDDLEVLRTELDLGVPRSADVRIQRLQREVADLNAYTEALEEFLDEEGTAEELIESFRADVAELEATVTDLEADLATTDEELEDVQAGLADAQHGVERVDDSVENLRDDLQAARRELTADIDNLDTDVSEVTDDVETLRENLEQEIDDVEDRLDATTTDIETTLEEELEAVRTEIDRTAEDVREETASNSDRIEALEEQLSEFEAFRERLEQAFGGMGGVDGDDEN